MLCSQLQNILHTYLPHACELGCLLEIKYRLSVEVMNAVGQGGGRGSSLLYSLRSLPERLQAAAPGCCHFALATWIHRQSDPWLTLQVALSAHPLQYYALLLLPDCFSIKILLIPKLRAWV